MRVSGGCACLVAAAALATVIAAMPARSYWVPGTQETTGTPDPRDPYRATAIVTGADMRGRPAGFANTLREVLVKVSGEPRLAGDARVAVLAAHAADYVASFGYHDQMAGIPPHDDQGTYDRPYDLTVRFDPRKIDDALSSLGVTPWRGPRPTIVPVITVDGPKGRYRLGAAEPKAAEQREAFVTAADQFGLAARFPLGPDFDGPAPSASGDPVAPPAAPSEIAVEGVLAFDESAPGWSGRWHTRWRGQDYRWTVDGVNYDAAFRNAVSGAFRIASGREAAR